MSTLLAKIQIHPGKEVQFEDVMAYMYRQTHGSEDDILRYEYWRGQRPGFYYCLLAFHDSLAFWRHQASEHHEGEMERFAECIAELDLEVIDPVSQASPLPETVTGELPEDEPPEVVQQAELYPITEADWWQSVRRTPDEPVQHQGIHELEDGLGQICEAPTDAGVLEMIVARTGTGEREVLVEADLNADEGLVGDNWLQRGRGKKGGNYSNPDMQLTIMNSRVAKLVAGSRKRWPLAGDQLYVDMDLSANNLPPGTQLSLGEALIEVTAEPHLGCRKFAERFGEDAVMFVNSNIGKQLKLRGINARVIQDGCIALGDALTKIS